MSGWRRRGSWRGALAVGGAGPEPALAVGADDEVERAGVAHPRRRPVAATRAAWRGFGAGDGGRRRGVRAPARGRRRAGDDDREQGDQRRERARDAWAGTVRAPLHRRGG